MTDNKDRFHVPIVKRVITLDVTGLKRRHILFFQLIAEYDLSSTKVQKGILEVLHCIQAQPDDYNDLRSGDSGRLIIDPKTGEVTGLEMDKEGRRGMTDAEFNVIYDKWKEDNQ